MNEERTSFSLPRTLSLLPSLTLAAPRAAAHPSPFRVINGGRLGGAPPESASRKLRPETPTGSYDTAGNSPWSRPDRGLNQSAPPSSPQSWLDASPAARPPGPVNNIVKCKHASIA